MAGLLQETAAKRTERAVEDLIAAAKHTKLDKVTWQPLNSGDDVLEMIRHCAHVNHRWAGILERGEWFLFTQEENAAYFAKLCTLDSALEALGEASARYVEVVRSMPDDRLESMISLPWGSRSIAECLLHALWHVSYHEGQVNYVQTLYGDLSES